MQGYHSKPLQLPAGVYPARRASSADSNHILFASEICWAPAHHGKWYFVPFLEATRRPPSILSGIPRGSLTEAVCATAWPLWSPERRPRAKPPNPTTMTMEITTHSLPIVVKKPLISPNLSRILMAYIIPYGT